MIDTMIKKQDHQTSQTKTNPEIGEVTIAIHSRLQRHDKIHPSRIFADNPGQIHLTLQYLTGLEIETPATIYPTIRCLQLPTTVTSQTWFNSLQQKMKLTNYWPFKLLRSPSSTANQSKNTRLSFNFFYFATGDTQKNSSLEIEIILDTGASGGIINYRIFWEICQTQHSITVKRSTIQTKTYSGQVVPMIGFATLTFSYDPDGQFFPFNRLDYRNENSKPSGLELLSKTST